MSHLARPPSAQHNLRPHLRYPQPSHIALHKTVHGDEVHLEQLSAAAPAASVNTDGGMERKKRRLPVLKPCSPFSIRLWSS